MSDRMAEIRDRLRVYECSLDGELRSDDVRYLLRRATELNSKANKALARVAALEDGLRECADSLEEEMRGHHGVGTDDKLKEMHPVSVRQFERDMASVRSARVLLATPGEGKE